MREEIFKAFLKVALKMGLPVLGEVIACSLEEAGILLLDKQKKDKADQLYARLLLGVKENLRESGPEATTDEELSSAAEIAAQVIDNYGIRPEEWAALNFKKEAADSLIITRSEKLLRDLPPKQKTLSTNLITSFHTSFLNDYEALSATEISFRKEVLSELDSLNSRTARADSLEKASTFNLSARAAVAIPVYPLQPDLSPPGALLRADHPQCVPFHGRILEITEAQSWCKSSEPISIRLYTGRGGIGKTRLFIEICRKLAIQGWRAGFLAKIPPDTPARFWSTLLRQRGPLICVVDYAETRLVEVNSFLTEAANSTTAHKVRVVLLARSAGDWWESMKTQDSIVGDLLSGSATSKHSVLPLAMTLKDRELSYSLALENFAAILGQEKPTSTTDLSSGEYEIALLLHMKALADIHSVPVKGDQGILDFVLRRERRFWRTQAIAQHLNETLLPGIAKAIAVIALQGGADTHGAAMLLLETIPFFSGQDRATMEALASLLHGLYPGQKYIEAILPDLLAEHLVQVELHKDEQLLDILLGSATH